MITLLKFLRGYLVIKIWGFSPERFLNLCSNKGILLWDIKKKEQTYELCIHLKNFYKLRDITKKTGTRVVILQRYGLPFFIPKFRKRKVFILGLFFAIAFLLFSSNFIWDIRLFGNFQITNDIFMDCLKENSVHIGMYRKEIDIEKLEKEIRKKFPQITWTSIKLSGSRLEIYVKENEKPEPSNESYEGMGEDLISTCDGIITSMIVRTGVPKVKIGEVVTQGQVLIEGKIPILNEDNTIREYQYVRSDADILIQHTISYEETLPLDHIEKVYTNRFKEIVYLRIGSKEYKKEPHIPYLYYDTVIKESRPALFEKLNIPIYLGESYYREYQNVEYVYDAMEAKDYLIRKCEIFILSLEEKGVQIIEKNVKIEKKNTMWILHGDFLSQEMIGEHVNIEKTTGDITENE